MGLDLQIGELTRSYNEAMDTLRKRRTEAAAGPAAEQEAILAELQPYALALGASYNNAIAKVKVTRPSQRRSWQLDGLDALESNRPDIWEEIKSMRKVAQVAGRVEIELIPVASPSEVTRVS